MKIRALLFAACAASTLCGTAASAATIVGQNVTVQYEFPNPGNVLTQNPYTIGDTTDQIYYGYFDFTMNDSFGEIKFNQSVGWTPATFNGFTINDTNNVLSDFTGISLDASTNPNFTNGRLSASADRLGINWQGLSFATGDTIRFNFTQDGVAGAVPEPATWAMMLLGFGFVGGAMRSSKRRQKLTVSYA